MEGRTDPLKGPTNHESASEAEENVGHAAEFVVFCVPATDPTSQCLMDGLRRGNLAGKPPQTVVLSQDNPEQARFEV